MVSVDELEESGILACLAERSESSYVEERGYDGSSSDIVYSLVDSEEDDDGCLFCYLSYLSFDKDFSDGYLDGVFEDWMMFAVLPPDDDDLPFVTIRPARDYDDSDMDDIRICDGEIYWDDDEWFVDSNDTAGMRRQETTSWSSYSSSTSSSYSSSYSSFSSSTSISSIEDVLYAAEKKPPSKPERKRNPNVPPGTELADGMSEGKRLETIPVKRYKDKIANAPSWYNTVNTVLNHFPARSLFWAVALPIFVYLALERTTGLDYIVMVVLDVLILVNIFIPVLYPVLYLIRIVADTALKVWAKNNSMGIDWEEAKVSKWEKPAAPSAS